MNLDGTFLMSKAFVLYMIQQKYGRIVNVASTSFYTNAPQMTAYIASKGSVIGFARALASEVGANVSTVNVSAPGLANTKTMKSVNAEIFDILSKMQVISKVIESEDLVGVVSFLCSKGAAFVTGQTIADYGR
nr:SDR family oxidoreductase [Chitinophaga costaii]